MSGAEQQDLMQRVRQARAKFLAMATAYSLGAFNDNFFRTAATMLAVSMGLTDFRGHATVVFALPFIVLAAPAGWLADRFSKRTVVIASKALEVAAMTAGAVGICTGNWVLMLLMVCTMGLQSAIFSPALNGSIPELYPAAYVLKANSLLRMAVTAAILIGTASGAVAMGLKGQARWGLSVNCVVVAGGALAVAIVGLAGSLGVPRRPAAAPGRKFPWSGPADTARELWAIRKDRLLAAVVSADVFVWFAGQLQVLIVFLLGGQFGIDEATTGLLLACELIGVGLGGLLSGRIGAAGRWRGLLGRAMLGLAAAMMAMAAVPHLPAWAQVPALAGLLWAGGLAGGMVLIPCEAFIQVRPAPQRKGAVIAAANAAAFVGILLAGPTANVLERLLSPTGSFAALGVLAAVAGTWLVLEMRRPEEA